MVSVWNLLTVFVSLITESGVLFFISISSSWQPTLMNIFFMYTKKAIQLIKVHLGDLKDLHDDALLLVLVPF